MHSIIFKEVAFNKMYTVDFAFDYDLSVDLFPVVQTQTSYTWI